MMIEGLYYILLDENFNQPLGQEKRVTVGDNICVRHHYDVYTSIHQLL